MIYIIDDKKDRQKTLAPNLKESELVKLIFQYNGDLETSKQDVFQNAKILAMHDSFFKNPVNRHPTKSEDEIRHDLKKYCAQSGIVLILFSGDYHGYQESNNGLLCQIGVTRFYENIDFFISEYNPAAINTKLLGFGRKYELEPILHMYLLWVKSFDTVSEKENLKVLCDSLSIELEALISLEKRSQILFLDQALIKYYENL